MANDEKCGLVFLSHSGKTIFHCTLCGNKYDRIEIYGVHVIDKHYSPEDDFEIDDLLPDFPNIMMEENTSDKDTIIDFCFETDEENSEECFQTKDDEVEDQYEKQCGEVNLSPEGMLIFCCTLCDSKFEGIREYDSHIMCEHATTEVLEEVEFEMVWPDNNRNNNENFEFAVKDDSNEVSFNVEYKPLNSTSELNEQNSKKTRPPWREMFDVIQCPDTNREKYECKLCGTVIRDKSNTQHHIKRVHENIKPHKCSECSKAYHSRTELKIHFRKHTGEKPYLCVECGMAFISASELYRHRETKHEKHVRDKFCPICNRGFFTMKHLQAHQSVHSEERPFKCKFCNAGFKKKTSLRTHMRIHEDKRQYKCNLCSASYNYKSILMSHMQSKHAVAAETTE